MGREKGAEVTRRPNPVAASLCRGVGCMNGDRAPLLQRAGVLNTREPAEIKRSGCDFGDAIYTPLALRP